MEHGNLQAWGVEQEGKRVDGSWAWLSWSPFNPQEAKSVVQYRDETVDENRVEYPRPGSSRNRFEDP